MLIATKNVKRGEIIFASPPSLSITSFSENPFNEVIKNYKLQEVRLITKLMSLRFLNDSEPTWARKYVKQMPEIIKYT